MTKKIIVNCAICGKEMEEVEEFEEDGVEVEYFCESCTIKELISALYDPKTVKIDDKRKVIKFAIEEKINLFDLKLQNETFRKVSDAIQSIAYLSMKGNKEAIKLVCETLKSESLHPSTKAYLVESLRGISEKRIINALLEILRKTKSDNRTRRLVRETLNTLASTRKKELIEPLFKLMASKNFSYKMKRNISDAIEKLDRDFDPLLR